MDESPGAGPTNFRLAVLGDSMAQGLVNGAVLEPRNSYPALIAKACGLRVGVANARGDGKPHFVVPSFFAPGIPFNIDQLLRDAEFWNGSELRSAYELLGFLTFAAVDVLRNRHHYQRVSPPGSGRLGPPDHLAIAGLSVRDCIELTPEECDERIASAEGTIDRLMAATAAKPLLRIAKQVLNSTGTPERQTWSAVRCLEELVRSRNPNVLIVHIGNADILSAVADLSVRLMPADFNGDRGRRRDFNVTHPAVFRRDFLDLADRVSKVLKKGEEPATVLVGTLPPATIAPFIRGFGRQDSEGYFDAYGRFFVQEAPSSRVAARTLSREQVRDLDGYVDAYNAAIVEVAKKHGWYVVDVHKMVSDLAVRRRFKQNDPSEPLRTHITNLTSKSTSEPSGIKALLGLEPVPDVRLFRANASGMRTQGGLFGFDCGHPSTLGYGLVADLFLRKLRELNIAAPTADIDWDAVIEAASSMEEPPRLWREVLNTLEAHPTIFDYIFRSGNSKLKQELIAKWRNFRS